MKKIVVLLIISASFLHAQSPLDVTYYTENYPPYNYIENGELTGHTIDIFMAIMEDMGIDYSKDKIIVEEWTRSYGIIQKRPNTCLMTMIWSESRDPLFKWVGPLQPTNLVLIAKKENNININSIEELNSHKVVAVKNDIGHIILNERGLLEENIFLRSNPTNIPTLLETGRVEIWSYNKDVAFALIKSKGYNIDDYEVIYTLGNISEGYITFNLETPDIIIDKFQESLDRLKANGTYNKIVSKY